MPSTSNGMSLTEAGRDRPQADVVAIQRGVDRPDGHGVVDAGDLGAERLGQPDSPALQADQCDTLEAVIALDDLVRHAGHRPPHVVRPEDLLALCHLCSCRTSLTGPASRSPSNLANA